MLKASTLLYSVIISLVIALITGSMLLFSGLSSKIFRHSMSQQELERNARSGLQLLLSGQEILKTGEEKIIDLYKEGNDSVFLSRKYWGAFEILLSKAVSHGQEDIVAGMAGYSADSSKNYSLYIADLDKPVSVCGNTIIKGTAFLPKPGIKRAYIEGQNYTGSSLVYGSIRQSEKTLPEFNRVIPEQIKNLHEQTEHSILIDSPEGQLSNSFLSPLKVIFSASAITLSDSLTGHIAVISKHMVTIEPGAYLRDIVIYAPKIKIRKGFKGNLQLFASDSIIVENEVSFNYPSVLGIVNETSAAAGIQLGENDTVCGSIFITDNNLKQKQQVPGISIPALSVIYGTVYSDGYADIKGKIFGSVMCNNIVLRTSSSIYENHLLNAVIDRTLLSSHFIGINFLENSGSNKIVKWLY
jgi:hypothetical protein